MSAPPEEPTTLAMLRRVEDDSRAAAIGEAQDRD